MLVYFLTALRYRWSAATRSEVLRFSGSDMTMMLGLKMTLKTPKSIAILLEHIFTFSHHYLL